MKAIAIATTGLLEHLRDRFVMIAIFVAIFLVGFSMILGSMSFDEQRRILLHFGLMAIHLSCVGISLFLGSYVLQREIERQTCLLTLVRPLSRAEFLIGKWFGVVSLEVIIWLILGLVLYGLLLFSFPFVSYAKALVGTLLEALILLSFTMCISLFLRPAIALFSGVGIFLVGHWQPDLIFFSEKSKDPIFKFFAQAMQYLSPQLHRMNWRSFHLIQNNVIDSDWMKAIVHGLCWVFFLLVLANVRFRRKDLV